MSKMTMMFEIRREVKSLNNAIDKKIIRNQSYEKESRRHRHLVSQLRKIEGEASMARTFALASFFL
ncbi:MAG: hypothetical protein WCQ00_00035 [bacterium]